MIRKMSMIIKRDLKLHFTSYSNFITPIVFFLVSIVIFPFAISNDPNILRSIGPGVILCSLLLSSSLVSHYLFEDDYENGIQEQIFLTSIPGYIVMMSKIIIHYLCVICPILSTGFMVGLFYNLTIKEVFFTTIIFLISSPLFSAISCLGSTISLNCKKGNFVAAFISLPLEISAIIFTSEAVSNIINSGNYYISYQSIESLLGLVFILLPLSCFFGGIIINNTIR
jgi:heme exporter protein B